MVIEYLLGHHSVLTTERYAKLTPATVNKHISEWNAK
jgi:site-specific recombinase XerD